MRSAREASTPMQAACRNRAGIPARGIPVAPVGGNVAAISPPSALRAPSPASEGRESVGDQLQCNRPVVRSQPVTYSQPVACNRPVACSQAFPSPAGGRRWRAAPDEGATVIATRLQAEQRAAPECRSTPPSALRAPSPASEGREPVSDQVQCNRPVARSQAFPSPAGGRRWRAAPDEGTTVIATRLQAEQRAAPECRSTPPIRPSGTFPPQAREGSRWATSCSATDQSRAARRSLLPLAGEGGAQRRMRARR